MSRSTLTLTINYICFSIKFYLLLVYCTFVYLKDVYIFDLLQILRLFNILSDFIVKRNDCMVVPTDKL